MILISRKFSCLLYLNYYLFPHFNINMMKVILVISFVLFLKETKGFLKCYIGESNSAFNTTGLRIGNCTRALNSFCFVNNFLLKKLFYYR
jgi:hypothetical protein